MKTNWRILLKSKTIWTNILTMIIGIIMALAEVDWVSENPKAAAMIMVAIGAFNIALRIIVMTPFLSDNQSPVPVIHHHIVELKRYRPEKGKK